MKKKFLAVLTAIAISISTVSAVSSDIPTLPMNESVVVIETLHSGIMVTTTTSVSEDGTITRTIEERDETGRVFVTVETESEDRVITISEQRDDPLERRLKYVYYRNSGITVSMQWIDGEFVEIEDVEGCGGCADCGRPD
jgi:hypothetical protein